MDSQKRLMLQAFQSDIIRDLDVKYIMDDLFAKNVVSSEVYDHILSNISNRADCVRFLLDSLLQSGDNAAFEGFVDSLSKDYRWLWEKLSIDGVGEERELLSESVEDSLSRGDVPRLPLHYVRREIEETKVAAELAKLKRHEALVLHGMSGSGKTCVASAALRGDAALLAERLATSVYWLSLATCRTEDDIRAQQLSLYRKASSSLAPRDTSLFSSTMSMSSLGSTVDSHSLASVNNSWKDFRDQLLSLFSEPPLKEGLLVLDDVSGRAVADAFDVGCKLLITTRDISAVEHLKPTVIEVESGFTEAESLELFSQCVGVRAEQLPRQARRLHALCKGGLLQISLLGANIAENRERLLHDPSHWNDYIKYLAQKDFLKLFHMRRDDQVDPTKPVEMCIRSLPPAVLALFRRLAVLREGARVSPRMLTVLWRESAPRVDSIMKQLRSKSLVVQYYMQEERNYVYEVHGLILACLRAMHSAEEMRRLHSELLARYGFLDVPATSPPRLLDDSYIALYPTYICMCYLCWQVHGLILACLRAMHSAEEMRRLHSELLARYGFLDVPATSPPRLLDDSYIALYPTYICMCYLCWQVHGLILACLRAMHSAEEMRRLHSELLARYGFLDVPATSPPRLLDDSYIALYPTYICMCYLCWQVHGLILACLRAMHSAEEMRRLHSELLARYGFLDVPATSPPRLLDDSYIALYPTYICMCYLCWQVHGLILACLRAMHSAEEMRRLHSELLARYGFLDVPATSPPRLLDDSYIALYPTYICMCYLCWQVHGLILACLRAMHSAEEMRRLHSELLARYGFLDVPATSPPRLLDDSYIALYPTYICMCYLCWQVHGLILACLRAMHSAEEMRRLHSELLARYGFLDVPATSPPRLLDDSYIAFYLAYHIYHTDNANNEWSLFKKLFLDLQFVGEKVRLAGQADTIGDLAEHQNRICHNEMEQSLVEALKEWLGAHGGDLHRFPHTDIVQSVLQHSCSGPLYANAHALAARLSAARRLYFTFLHEQCVDKYDRERDVSIDVGEAVSSVGFLGNYILVGLKSGKIKVYNTHTYRMCKELAGGNSAVVWVRACPDNTRRVASLDATGTLRVWCIDQLEPSSPTDTDTVDEESEETEDCIIDCGDKEMRVSSEYGAHLNCRWASNGKLLAHTASAVLFYSSEAQLLSSFHLPLTRGELPGERVIVCCTLVGNDMELAVASVRAEQYDVDIYNVNTKEKLLTFDQETPILQILSIPTSASRVLVVCEEMVSEHTWAWPAALTRGAGTRTPRTRTLLARGAVRAGLRLRSAAVNVAGTLLFLATDDARVLCLDLATHALILDLPNRRGNVVSMDVSELWFDEFICHYDVLGTGDEENCVKVWHLDTAYIAQASNRHRKARLTSQFACSFSSAATSPGSGRSSPRAAPPAPLTPRRANSSAAPSERQLLRKTASLSERRSLKLNLNGISNGSDDTVLQPLLAVIDDKNNIQIMRGRRVSSEISGAAEDTITAVQISPCNHYVIFGVKSGAVKKFVLRSNETLVICDINSAVVYLEFVTPHLLIVSGKNRCVMAYWLAESEDDCRPTMLLPGNAHLGSQEILNDIIGNKKKFPDSQSTSSEGSVGGSPRVFGAEARARGGGGGVGGGALVHCTWLAGLGLVTVEDTGSVKLWDERLSLHAVLAARQPGAAVTCADLRANTLALCDDLGKFQTFQLRKVDGCLQMSSVQEYKLNCKITACAVSRAGRLLAMGLDNGQIVLWNIRAKYQIKLLKLHKSSVTSLLFSPEPAGAGAGAASPRPSAHTPNTSAEESGAPLVLVSVAAEVLWWDVTHIIRTKQSDSKPRTSKNMLTPIQSPNDRRNSTTPSLENLHIDSNCNHFFGNGAVTSEDTWEALWRGKRSDKTPRELLACVKLAGVSARRLLADPSFCCFVTVDSSGAPHLMNLMRPS